MNSKEVLEYLGHPEKLQKQQAEQLERALEEYPYSGVLHALYLKALKNQNNYLYPKQLKRTAIAVPDRKALYYWVEASAEVVPDFEKPKIEFHPEPKPAPAAEVEKPQPQPVEPIVSAPAPVKETPVVPPVPAQPKPIPVAAEVVPPTPKVVAAPPQTVAESELDLSNLPASVRETVLRARRIRQQFGNAFNDAAPAGKTETASSQIVPQIPAPQPAPVEVVPSFELNIQPAAEIEPIAPAQPPPPQPEVLPEPVAAAESFSIVIDEPVAEATAEEHQPHKPREASEPNLRLSFLDWLAAEEEASEREHEFVDANVPLAIVPPPAKPAAEPEFIAERTAPEMPEKTLISETLTEQIPAPEAPKPSTEEVKNLYETFMEKRPKPRIDFRATDAAIETASLGTSDYAAYITETLAQVYVRQKLYDRAINAYEILGLKYPEKSGLFAARISEIKRLLND